MSGEPMASKTIKKNNSRLNYLFRKKHFLTASLRRQDFDNSRFAEELLSEIKKLEPLNKNISIFHDVCMYWSSWK